LGTVKEEENMPGIVGLLSKSNKGDCTQLVSAMSKTMLHEPFYRHGLYENKEHGYFIGYSAIENSFADCMPYSMP